MSAVRRHLRWPLRLLALAGTVTAFWLIFRRLDARALLEVFQRLRPGWYLLGFGLFGLGLLPSALRWHLMLRINDAAVHAGVSLRMVFISHFFNTALVGPSSGDVPKTALYRRWYGMPAHAVLAASMLDRLVAGFAGLLFVSAALALAAATGGFAFLQRLDWRPDPRWVLAAAAAAAALVAALAWHQRRRREAFLSRTLRSLGGAARRLVGEWRASARALLLSLGVVLILNFAQLCCLQAVSPQALPWTQLLWAFHVITMIASLPVTVAGAGLREGAYLVLLRAYGVDAPTAVAAAMLTLTLHAGWALIGIALLAHERRVRKRLGHRPPARTVSALVPALNEEAALPETLARLKAVPEIGEIIVADGGSSDRTVAVAEAAGARVVRSGPGRGTQLRAAAAVASGDVLLLVHADTWLPPEAGRALLRALHDSTVAAGGFWKRFRDAPALTTGSRIRCWLRLAWGRRVLGDQAMYVRRVDLEAAGGVPDVPLMEDVLLCARLRTRGRLALATATVRTSARRFRERGALRTYALMWRVWRGHRRGEPPAELARKYR
ncbi:MAG: TIGR04283 family arsenosugar biosynthesis glycosyltransferase [Limisphaerales bacterium]